MQETVHLDDNPNTPIAPEVAEAVRASQGRAIPQGCPEVIEGGTVGVGPQQRSGADVLRAKQ